MRKFVKFVKNPLPGEKNGRKTGNKFSFAVNAVEEIKIKRNETCPIHFSEPLFIFFREFLCKQEEKG